MPSETIWSNTSGPSSPHLSSNYRSVLELVDTDVAKILGSDAHSESGRFSFKDSGEIESNLFDFKASLAQVSYAASTGGPHAPRGIGNPNSPPFQLGTASISGGIASRHPPQDSFLHKFSSVADATRDIELSNTLGSLTLDNNPRRSSFNSEQNMKPFNVSPHGSMNENLNMPAPRNSRHQSISEKIDNYNNHSPIQASAALSISSDLNSNPGNAGAPDHAKIGAGHSHPHGFWNPATATSFTPTQTFNYFLENPAFPTGGNPMPPNPYARQPPAMPPISPPPFMMGNPHFVEGGMYGFMGYPAPVEQPAAAEETPQDESGEKPTGDGDKAGRTLPPKSGPLPGIGLMNRQMAPSPAFMFHPFNPYGAYPQNAPPASPPVPVDASSGDAHNVPPPMQPGAFEAPMMPPAHPAARPSSQPPQNNAGHGKKSKAARGTGNGKGGHHIYRSPLLEEVRSNSKGKEYFLKDIYGHVVEFTKDQHGSRFIQQKLPSASDEEKEVVFNEIRDISYELMTDVFGNYVIQKFFEHGTPTQKEVLLDCMQNSIYDLSLQMYGCRVVQRALESLPLEGQLRVVEELRDHVLVAAKDQNGNHVIQKSIERIPFERIRFILDSLSNHIYHLSTHPYGCRVIQRLLEYSEIEDQQEIMNELNRFIFYLIQDQYGNYVIQHILERGNPEDREEVLKIALGSVVNFSKHKFASNVIEKCIKFGNTEQRRRILQEVMLGNEDLEKETVDDDSPLALMMKDQYANYVIQKLVEGFDAKSVEKKSLVVKLRQYLKQLSMKNNYGKHLASVEKMIVVAETALVDADRV